MNSREIFNSLPKSAQETATTYVAKFATPVIQANYKTLLDNLDQTYGEYWHNTTNLAIIGENDFIMLKSEPETVYLALSNSPVAIKGLGLNIPVLNLNDIYIEGMPIEASIHLFPLKPVPPDLVSISVKTANTQIAERQKQLATGKGKAKSAVGRPPAAATKTKVVKEKPVKEKKPKVQGSFLDLSSLGEPQPTDIVAENPPPSDEIYLIDTPKKPAQKTKEKPPAKTKAKPDKKEKETVVTPPIIELTVDPLTKEDKKKKLEELQQGRELAKKLAQEHTANTQKDAAVKEANIKNMLVNRCVLKIRDIGYGFDESNAICATQFGKEIVNLSKEVVAGKLNEGEALKTIGLSVKRDIAPPQTPEEALAGAPIVVPEPPKPHKTEKGTKNSAEINAEILLSERCMKAMAELGKNEEEAIKECQRKQVEISRLAKAIVDGKLSPLDAASELRATILTTTQFETKRIFPTTRVEENTEHFLEVQQRANIKVQNAAYNTFMAQQKRALPPAEFDKLAAQGRPSTIPGAKQFKIMLESAPYEVNFNGPRKPAGLTQHQKAEWDSMVYQKYIQVLSDEFDVQIVASRGNFSAFFTAVINKETGTITLMQNKKEYLNFRDTLERMRARFPTEEMFISTTSPVAKRVGFPGTDGEYEGLNLA